MNPREAPAAPAPVPRLSKHIRRVLGRLPGSVGLLKRAHQLSHADLSDLRSDLEELHGFVSTTANAEKLVAELADRRDVAAALVHMAAWSARLELSGSEQLLAVRLHVIARRSMELVTLLLDAAAGLARGSSAVPEAGTMNLLLDALIKTQTLQAASRQAAAAASALARAAGAGPGGAAAPQAGSPQDMHLRVRSAQQAAAVLSLADSMARFTQNPDSQESDGQRSRLLSSLHESALLDHTGRLLLLLRPPPGGQAPPAAELASLAAAQCKGLEYFSNVVTLTCNVGGVDHVDNLRERYGPCVIHGLLTLGASSLAVADLGPCGLPRDPVLAVPQWRGSVRALPSLHSMTMLAFVTALRLDVNLPRPSLRPRPAMRLALRVMQLGGVSARARRPAHVIVQTPSEMRIDVGWSGGRRYSAQRLRHLLPDDRGGTVLAAATALVKAAERWPGAWAAEARHSWAPLFTAVVHCVGAAAVEEDMREALVGRLGQLLCAATEPLVDLKGASVSVQVPAPAQLPPCVAAALEGGVVPLFETLIRAAGEDPPGPEALVVLHLLGHGHVSHGLAALVVHSPPRQAAAFLATLAKVLRRTAHEAMPNRHWALLASLLVDHCNDLLDIAAPTAPAPPADVVRVLSLALHGLLPDLSSFVQGLAKGLLVGSPNAPGVRALGVLVDDGLLAVLPGALDLAARAAPRTEGPAPDPTHRLASSVCLPFLVEECGAVPLLGAMMDLVQRYDDVPGCEGLGLGPAIHDSLSLCCLGVHEAYPDQLWWSDGSSAAGDGGSSSGGPAVAAWRPEALRFLGSKLQATDPERSGKLSALAVLLSFPRGANTASRGGASAALMAEAERLAVIKAEARALLPACANPACVNLRGDSEAGLKLQQCAQCKGVSYCCRECQTAHGKAGHTAVCAAEGG